ncbi:Hint domain-containing protein [Hufsiella ginkgonis]|uniref:Hint domain-containing protein n=1 Tax=Hufsiella ginkgonis TaxID=2695274 RepID=A0A7K1XUI8_9SPHI|nr:Hint domain-containing protein [Hufsiella ginkgonis]MXV14671.1 hypothetical protein [Hufsiella ginkgonis]
MLKVTSTLLLLFITTFSLAQETPNPRPMTMAEYQKAKTFSIANLDNDTYVKFENAYILDRYEARKPYFITGDDGQKKRIDLYKLIAREGMQELGLFIFYTNEQGKVFKACMPNFTADAKVWEQYFNDIDNINKVEKNYVLKLSYILSKELGFQLYKALNQGKDLSKESATYGNDVCFPGDEEVTMADGSTKQLHDVRPGDLVITVDARTRQSTAVKVRALSVHDAKNYAITSLTLVSAKETLLNGYNQVALSAKVLSATPNHPMRTSTGDRKIGEIAEGENVLCLDEKTGKYEPFVVLGKKEFAGGTQKVYNIVAEGGDTFLMNGVMVKQK